MNPIEKAQELAKEIQDKQFSEAQSKIRRIPVKSNWASVIGHPCLRYRVYHRTHWNEVPLHDPSLQFVFDEGIDRERFAIRKLQDLGYDVVQQQGSGDKDSLFDEKLNIGLRIDGRIRRGEEKPVIEVKSMSPYDYEAIKSYEDMKHHKKWRIRSYCAQGQLCLFKMNAEYGLYLLVTYRRPIKAIPFVLDYEFVESIIKQTELVNEYVAKKELPEPDTSIEDGIHAECPFLHICGVTRQLGDDVQIIEDEEIICLLNKRASLEKSSKEFEKIDERLKEYFKTRRESIAGDFHIFTTDRKSTKYNIPDEIKAPYKVESVSKVVKIEPLKIEKGSNDD